MSKIVDLVRQAQLAQHLSDEETARRLRISRPFWVRIRCGKRGTSIRFLKGVVRGFPELSIDAVLYLRDNGHESG